MDRSKWFVEFIKTKLELARTLINLANVKKSRSAASARELCDRAIRAYEDAEEYLTVAQTAISKEECDELARMGAEVDAAIRRMSALL